MVVCTLYSQFITLKVSPPLQSVRSKRIEAVVVYAVSSITVKLWNPDTLDLNGLAVGQTLTARNVRVDHYGSTVSLSTNRYSQVQVNAIYKFTVIILITATSFFSYGQ